MQDNIGQGNLRQNPMPVSQTDQSSQTNSQASPLPQVEPVSWTASQSVAQQRSKNWYLIAGAIFLLIVVADVLLFIFKVTDLTTLITSLVLIAAMFIALLISTKQPNRESTYVLSPEGITINGNKHGLDEFRAFGVRQHGGLWQLVLIPVKRFGMEVVTYIDEQHGEKIVDILASYLPMEEVPESGIDKLIDRLKI